MKVTALAQELAALAGGDAQGVARLSALETAWSSRPSFYRMPFPPMRVRTRPDIAGSNCNMMRLVSVSGMQRPSGCRACS